MKLLVAAFGYGLGSVLLFFAVTYLVMSKKLKFKFSNLKIIVLLLIAAFLNGVILYLIPDIMNLNTTKTDDSLWFILSAFVPIIISVVVIKSAYKLSLKK